MLYTRGIVVVVATLVLVGLSKVAFGTRRMGAGSRETAGLTFAAMQRWARESAASNDPLTAYTDAVYAHAYANILRNMLDDNQSQRLFGVNMLRTVQDLEKLMNSKAKQLQGGNRFVAAGGARSVGAVG